MLHAAVTTLTAIVSSKAGQFGRRVSASLSAVVLLGIVAILAPGAAIGEQASDPSSPAAGQLDEGANFSCAIVTGGQVRCWGYGRDGELGYPGVTTVGINDTPAAVGPVDIGAGFTAKAISSGDYHTCVIRNDGSVVCWGYGINGRLGYGNPNNVGDTQTPGSVGPVNLGGHTAKAITAGGAHTCVILDDNSVRCWGFGGNGELGYGSMANQGDTPSDTPNLEQPVDLGTGRTAKAISAGSSHTCAILDTGNVICWGYGGSGRLGYGNTTNIGDVHTPGSVGPVNLGGQTAVAITAGGQHTCAILNDGSVRCWGFGFSGQLGYGNQNDVGDSASSPTAGSGGPVDLGAGRTAVAISAGGAHTCAILDNSSVLCWGYGADGRLGYGNANNVGDAPSDLPGLIGPVNLGTGRTAMAISAGDRQTCAQLDGGSLRCWGYGANGRLGYCSESNVGDTPTNTPDTAGPVNLVPGDGGQPCAVPSPVPVLEQNVSLPSISGKVITGQTLTEAHGSWSPIPASFAYQWERCDRKGANCGSISGAAAQTYKLGAGDVGSTIRVLETATDSSTSSSSATSAPTTIVKAPRVRDRDAARKRKWRSCLARVTAGAHHLRALTHRGSMHQRAQARRRLARKLARGRKRCVKTAGRTPGPITDLLATTAGPTAISLAFLAPGTDGFHPPPSRNYLVKASLSPIRTRRDFVRAASLCLRDCVLDVRNVGDAVAIVVTHLRPRTTYYFIVVARDNVTLKCGSASPEVHARTGPHPSGGHPLSPVGQRRSLPCLPTPWPRR